MLKKLYKHHSTSPKNWVRGAADIDGKQSAWERMADPWDKEKSGNWERDHRTIVRMTHFLATGTRSHHV